jgi:hypothetical protein
MMSKRTEGSPSGSNHLQCRCYLEADIAYALKRNVKKVLFINKQGKEIDHSG